jgi:signal transduction histidine kinase
LDSLKDVPLHLALDNTGVGLVACDATGLMTLISPVLQELFGMTYQPQVEPFRVEEMPLYQVDGTTPIAPDEVPLSRARRGEFVRDEVVTHRRSTGRLVHLKCNAVPLRDAAGNGVGAISLVQDVTAEIESALRAEELRKRLVETINHEFRTPLAALLGHVELIHDHRDRREDLDPDLAQWLDAIDRSAWRLRDLLDEVAELVNAEDDEPVDRRPRRAG